MKTLTNVYETRGFVVAIEVLYLLILFVIAVLYVESQNIFHTSLPPTLAGLPVGVPWFGALGAVIISLSGAFDHRNDWDATWNAWHLTRPLIGISLAIVAWLIFQAGILAVGSVPPATAAAGNGALAPGVTAPTNLLFYVIAFMVGYREAIFRELIKRVTDVILSPGTDAPKTPVPVVTSLNPKTGSAAGGETVTITGSGLLGATSVKFGATEASKMQITDDTTISVQTPAATAGAVSVTVTTSGGSANAGAFTYGP
jgi:IPT/TIG domain